MSNGFRTELTLGRKCNCNTPQIIPQMSKEGTFPNYFYKVSTNMIPKQDKNSAA